MEFFLVYFRHSIFSFSTVSVDQNLLTVFNKMNYLVSECYTTHTHLETYICICFSFRKLQINYSIIVNT